MRIALVVPGGVDRSAQYRVIPALLALMERLSQRNEVHVFALSQQAEPGTWELLGTQVHSTGFRRNRLRTVRAIAALHRAAPFDVVHSIWSGSCGLVAVIAAALAGIPSLIHIAGGELVALPEIGYGGRLTWRGRMREALVLRAADKITAASAPVIQSLKSLGLQAERVPLGVDLEAWQPRQPTRRGTDRPARLIHLGSLNPVKDQETLLRALAVLSRSGVSFEMQIVGEDIMRGAIQTLAAQLQLADVVRFRGFMTQRELRPVVESADVMIMSSRHEAGPLAMLEAAVAGVPTVGTAVGHIAEWSPDASVAVPVGDWAALAAAVAELLRNEELRLRIARAAHARAIAEDADFTAARFQCLYASLTAHRRVRA